MCGRTACTLSRDQLQRRCTFASGGGGRNAQGQPNWRDLPCSPPYSPGYNQPPGKFLPVLYSDPAGEPGSRLISTMKWGLVPSWVGRDSSGFSLHMSNARVETLMEKASFRNLVLKGRRCVLLCEGFYEWKRSKLGSAGSKQAYFFHPPGWTEQQQHQQVSDEVSPSSLMFIAALFDVHKEIPGQPDLYSFTVITVPASSAVSDIHDRMPAILQTADQIAAWLQSDNPNQATACLQSVTDICFYPVSSHVNSTQHNDKLCLQPIKLEAGALPTLEKWLPPAASKSSGSAAAVAASSNSSSQQSAKPSPKRPLPDTGLTRWIRSGGVGKPQQAKAEVEEVEDAAKQAIKKARFD